MPWFSRGHAAILSVFALALAASCSSDLFHSTDWASLCDADPSTPGCSPAGAGGSSTHTSSSRSSSQSSSHAATGAGGNSSGGGGGSGGAGGAPDPCPTYCQDIQASCSGPYQQYETAQDCLNLCGKLSHLPGTNTDNVECRADRAADAHNNLNECYTAGPSGEVQTGILSCGSTCDAYCLIMRQSCAGMGSQGPMCASDCEAFGPPGDYSVAASTGKTQACHLYWAIQAFSDVTACTNALKDSPACGGTGGGGGSGGTGGSPGAGGGTAGAGG